MTAPDQPPWYTGPTEDGPQVGDLVVAIGLFDRAYTWVGPIKEAWLCGSSGWRVRVMADGGWWSYWADRVRRPTPEELAVYGFTGSTPTAPVPVNTTTHQDAR